MPLNHLASLPEMNFAEEKTVQKNKRNRIKKDFSIPLVKDSFRIKE